VRPALALVAVLALAGCSAPAPSTVTVFAAASLSGPFEQIAEAFETEHPGVEVRFNFGGSSALATQIVEGAPADVFAAASPATMMTVTDARLAVGDPADFATNVLEIAVASGNPGRIERLEDFADPGRTIAVCAVEVPCGAASAKLFETVGITPSVDTYEQDVKAVLTKVELGEVDAGLVYVTDVRAAAGRVEGIAVDSEPVAYPIAALDGRADTAAFVAFVLSDRGQRILREAGFGAP
jgi:molybdate transport system substrate-binding protein